MIKCYNIIGLMSGTSLDGLDVAFCRFEPIGDGKFKYSILEAETYLYTKEWIERLKMLPFSSAEDLAITDVEFGHLIGVMTRKFIDKCAFKPDYVASHGHTVFHQPEKHFTLQIGNGSTIASECGFPVIFDFRSLDVALGGQGAPLVPVGDMLLFSDYDACLNIGGISNISFTENGKRVAFDVSPSNIVLNDLSKRLGMDYDDKGKVAESGRICSELKDRLDRLDYYKHSYPKSLGREWIDSVFMSELSKYELSVEDLLSTSVEHIACQISAILNTKKIKKVLVSGGGAKNEYLLKRIRSKVSDTEICIPEEKIINYKESLIFAFLGLLRILGKPNCLSSVTGSCMDNCGGVICLP